MLIVIVRAEQDVLDIPVVIILADAGGANAPRGFGADPSRKLLRGHPRVANGSSQVWPKFWSDAYARSMRLCFMQKLTGLGGRPGSECLIQHLREVAIDHAGGVFEGTNDFVENIGGRSPLTVEAFVTEHRHALEQR